MGKARNPTFNCTYKGIPLNSIQNECIKLYFKYSKESRNDALVWRTAPYGY